MYLDCETCNVPSLETAGHRVSAILLQSLASVLELALQCPWEA